MRKTPEPFESPIEERMFCALAFADWPSTKTRDEIRNAGLGSAALALLSGEATEQADAMLARAYSRLRLMRDTVTVEPQVKIGKYRVDFLVKARFLIVDEEWHACVVECDGREFHSSVEQRKRDWERDRELARMGYDTQRFTGSQIHHDAGWCAEITLGVMRELNLATRFPERIPA